MRSHAIRLLPVVAAVAALLGGVAATRAHALNLGVAATRASTTGNIREVRPTLDTARVGFVWQAVQHNCRDIRRRTYDWEATDRYMRWFLVGGLEVLGTFGGTPRCAAVAHRQGMQPQARYRHAFAAFVRRAVARYGPGGTWFAAHPNRACCGLTEVEVWSEENIPQSWVRPSARSYLALLEPVADALADLPKPAGAVHLDLGGLAASNSTTFLRALYRRPGFKRLVDRIDVHTYSRTPRDSLAVVEDARRVMRQNDDEHTRIQISEHAWSTCPRPDPSKFRGKCTTVPGQARKLREYVGLLRRHPELRVRTLLWFTLQDTAVPADVRGCRSSPKSFYGFFDHSGAPKPSWDVWQSLTGVSTPAVVLSENPFHFGCGHK